MPALAMGVLVSLFCYTACTAVKARLGYDDSLDAFGVHGVGGTLGAILTGVFATRATGACGDGKPLGLLEDGHVLTAQVIAVLMSWGLAVVGTLVILKVLDAVMGLRVSRDEETEGLDLSQHGEEGYIFI
jgi:Amt family ammonium transporter